MGYERSWPLRGVLKLYSKNIEKFLDNRGRIHIRLHHEQYCKLSWIIMEISGNLWKAGSASEPCEKKHTWGYFWGEKGNSVSQKASLELLLSCFSDTLPHQWYARWVISKSFNWPSILPNTAPSIGQSSGSRTRKWNLVSTSVELGRLGNLPSSTDLASCASRPAARPSALFLVNPLF